MDSASIPVEKNRNKRWGYPMSTVPKPSHANQLADSHGGISINIIAGNLSRRELRRRMWHMLPGLTPFVLWPIEHADPLSPTLKLIILAVAVLVAGSIYVKFRHVSRDSSENRAEAVLGYVMSVLGSLLLFPAHPEIGFTVLAVLAFGDGSATFGGLLFPSRSLPWNQDKTVSGMFSFILMGTIMASVIYWGEANPGVDWMSALLIAVPTSICAAIAESLPVRLNDNVRVGVVAAIVAPIAHYFVLGF
jgi:dolichol kinase